MRLIAFLTLIATCLFALSPAFTAPFTGFREDQLPIPQLDPPIQPAGYAFAIWGLIYAWLVVSAIYGVWKRSNDPDWHRARVFLLVSLTIGVPWLAIANANAIWATATIILMAVFAIAALTRAPENDRSLFAAPVGNYAGWLTAASWVSIGSVGAGYGFIADQLGWAYLGIVGAVVVAATVFNQTRTIPYALTVVWASVGIIIANLSLNTGVVLFASGGILLLLGLALYMQRVGRSPRV